MTFNFGFGQDTIQERVPFKTNFIVNSRARFNSRSG